MRIYKITWILGNIIGLSPYPFGYANFDTPHIVSVILSTLILLVSVLEGLSPRESAFRYGALSFLGVFSFFTPFIFNCSYLVIPSMIFYIIGFLLFTFSFRKYLKVAEGQRELYLKDI